MSRHRLARTGPTRRPARRSLAGQAMVEFALVAFPFLLVTMALMDWGLYQEQRAVVINNAHDSVRYASSHSAAWSNAASPPAASVEGVAIQDAGGLVIANNDTAIEIKYYVPGAGAAVYCGRYSQATNNFVSSGAIDPNTGSAYVQSGCVTSGNLVSVKLTYVFRPLTPLPAMASTISLTSTAVTTQEV